MKRFISVLLLIVTVFLLAIPATATAPEIDSSVVEVIPLDNGDYIVITISDDIATRASGSFTKGKSTNYYRSDDVLAWTVTLYGDFTYNGYSATCLDARITVSIYDSDWSCSAKNAYASGSTAYGNATMVRKITGVVVDTRNVSLTLTCDRYGNVY